MLRNVVGFKERFYRSSWIVPIAFPAVVEQLNFINLRNYRSHRTVYQSKG